jgi:hypothetical protein
LNVAFEEIINSSITGLYIDIEEIVLSGVKDGSVNKRLVKEDEVDTAFIEHFVIFETFFGITAHTGDTVKHDGVSCFYLTHELVPVWTVLLGTCVEVFDDGGGRVERSDVGYLST